jgi:hypothetical protein
VAKIMNNLNVCSAHCATAIYTHGPGLRVIPLSCCVNSKLYVRRLQGSSCQITTSSHHNIPTFCSLFIRIFC